MPVSGRPTNAALLKTTQGSSGPEMKPFQKTRNAAGTVSLWLAWLTGGELRVAKSHTMTRMAAARNMEREMTSVPHLRSVLFSKDSVRAAPFCVPAEVFVGEELR